MKNKDKSTFNWKQYWKNWVVVLTILAMIGFIVYFTVLWEEKWDIKKIYGNNGMSLFGLVALVISCFVFAGNRKNFSVTRWIIYTSLMLVAGILINSIGGFVLTTILISLFCLEIPYNINQFKTYKRDKKDDITTSD